MIDVVVVTADSKEMVLACLGELESPTIGSITVVDNGSRDGTEEAVRSAFPAVDVLRLTEPQALSAAFNRGAERGSESFVLFLNDDVLATEGSLEELERALESNSGAVAAAGRLVDPEDGSTQLEYQPKPFPTAATFVASVAGLPRLWPRNPWTGETLRHPLSEHATVVVDQPPGACLLVRRDVFEAIGGWDEGYAFWYEDVDLARRLREHGDVIYVPTAVYKHVGGHSARRLSRSEVVERSYGGTLRYAGRHFGDWQRRVVGATFAVTSSIRALSVRRSDPELAKTYRRIGRRAATLALGNGFVKHPRVEPLVATALRGSAVRGSSRFALREVLGRGRVGRYRLRDADFDVLIRHGTADAAILGEVFYQRDYEFPQPVRAALEALGRPPVVADLGANIGLFGLWVLRSFPAAEIVAFEPDPANLAVLRRCVSLNERSGKWEVVPAAASTEDGAVPFTTGGGSVSRIAADEAAQTVPALDVFPYLERADLIKIDIEGGEWAILNDPRFADLRPAAVVLEFHPHMSPRPDTHAAAVELLSRTGLEIADGPDYGSGQGVLWGWRTEGRT